MSKRGGVCVCGGGQSKRKLELDENFSFYSERDGCRRRVLSSGGA